MATILYNRIGDSFMLYHGNNVNAFIGYCIDRCKKTYIDKMPIPMYSEKEIVGEDKFYTAKDFYEQKMKNTFYSDNYFYPQREIRVYIDDNDNDVNYYPLEIKLREISDSVTKGFNRSISDILSFFGMNEEYYKEMVAFMNKQNYDIIVVKNNVKIYIASLDRKGYMCSIFQGEPIEKCFLVSWKDRYKTAIRIDIPNYYKKEIKHKYIGGTNGEIFERAYFDFLWPNFFQIEPIKYKSIYDFPSIIDYDTLSCLSIEQKVLIKAKELEAEKKRERLIREREENRKKDGYCDKCGSPNASYVENPYMKEMYNMSVMQWLCNDCYDDCLGDI